MWANKEVPGPQMKEQTLIILCKKHYRQAHYYSDLCVQVNGVKSPASIFPVVNARESMVQTVLSSEVAWCAKVKITANTTLPPDPWDTLLAARVTDDVGMKVT